MASSRLSDFIVRPNTHGTSSGEGDFSEFELFRGYFMGNGQKKLSTELVGQEGTPGTYVKLVFDTGWGDAAYDLVAGLRFIPSKDDSENVYLVADLVGIEKSILGYRLLRWTKEILSKDDQKITILDKLYFVKGGDIGTNPVVMAKWPWKRPT